MFRPAIILAVLILVALPALAVEQAPAGPAAGVTIEHVAGKVYMISGAGGNIGALITESGILLVDSGRPGTGEAVLAALRTISDKPVVQIINTHWHPDHTGGNGSFGDSVTVIAHANQRASAAFGGTVLGKPVPPAVETSLNMVCYDDSLRIFLDGEAVEILFLPKSHSGGDVIVSFKTSKVVQLGDLLFISRFPYVDHADGGAMTGIAGNLKYLQAKIPKDAKLIPGHGPVSAVSDLITSQSMITETNYAVRLGRRGGKTVDELMNDPAIKKYANWAWDIVSMREYVEMLYAEAPAQRKRDTKGPGFEPETKPVTPPKH